MNRKDGRMSSCRDGRHGNTWRVITRLGLFTAPKERRECKNDNGRHVLTFSSTQNSMMNMGTARGTANKFRIICVSLGHFKKTVAL